MSEVTLRAETGRTTGTRPSRRLRRQGKVPATLYGHDTDAVSVAVDARELRTALSTDAGINAVIRLRVGKETHTSLARQLQRHPTRGDIIHLDFVKIALTDRVDAVVHVELIGDPVGVTEDGGIVETVANTVNVHTLVTAIPESIQIDISDLRAGQSVRVADLPALGGVDYLDDPGQPIVTISLPAAALVEEEEHEEGDLEPGDPDDTGVTA
ncbi:MAG: 50S ribosomal protein L25 [bacterium]|nr:50S ribosomal protein L25 [bacterium]MDE0290863.1 50S ribosomal protein L25 [bacterium]MDE0439221.1 50S ribosomal protein L25 [bacterium]